MTSYLVQQLQMIDFLEVKTKFEFILDRLSGPAQDRGSKKPDQPLRQHIYFITVE